MCGSAMQLEFSWRRGERAEATAVPRRTQYADVTRATRPDWSRVASNHALQRGHEHALELLLLHARGSGVGMGNTHHRETAEVCVRGARGHYGSARGYACHGAQQAPLSRTPDRTRLVAIPWGMAGIE